MYWIHQNRNFVPQCIERGCTNSLLHWSRLKDSIYCHTKRNLREKKKQPQKRETAISMSCRCPLSCFYLLTDGPILSGNGIQFSFDNYRLGNPIRSSSIPPAFGAWMSIQRVMKAKNRCFRQDRLWPVAPMTPFGFGTSTKTCPTKPSTGERNWFLD